MSDLAERLKALHDEMGRRPCPPMTDYDWWVALSIALGEAAEAVDERDQERERFREYSLRAGDLYTAALARAEQAERDVWGLRQSLALAETRAAAAELTAAGAKASQHKAERQLTEAREALKPFAEFAAKWNANPISGLADELYSIYAGDISASLRLSDCQRALTAQEPPE